MEKQDKEAIEELLRDFQEALNTSNAEKSVSLYTKDGIFMPSETSTAIGAEDILRAYQCIFSRIRISIDFYIQEISIEGEFAFAVTTSKSEVLVRASDTEAAEENRELFVFEKNNGGWKIARYMFNRMP